MTLPTVLTSSLPTPSTPLTGPPLSSLIVEILLISQDLTEHMGPSKAFPFWPKSQFYPTFSCVSLIQEQMHSFCSAVYVLCLLLRNVFFEDGFNLTHSF